MRCYIAPGAPLEARCLTCGQRTLSIGSRHRFCLGCVEVELGRLDLHEEMHTRLDQLAFAVQVLTERLDAGRIEDLERRLDEFVSGWPRAGAQ